MRQKTFRTKLGILAIAAGALLTGMFFVSAFSPRLAFAFSGPSQAPSGGSGAIGSDSSNNVSIGTPTTISGTKLLVVGAGSGDTGSNALQILQNNRTPIFLLRDDGSVSISTSTVSAGNTVIGGGLTVGNNLIVGGTFTASSLGASTISAGNVSSGQFGSNTGGSGNYYFMGGNVGIGTTSPGAYTLNVQGSGFFGTNTTVHPLIISNDLSSSPSVAGSPSNGMFIMDNGGSPDLSMGFLGSGGLWMQNASPAFAGYYYPISLNPNGGNVGIGTTTPAYALDVNGDVNVSGQFRVNGTPFTGGGNQWTTSGNNIYSSNSGNVGIGTTGPVSALNVAGTTGFTRPGYGAGASYGLVTIGTRTTGGSLFINTPSGDSGSDTGLAIDGTYGSQISTVNIKAIGVNFGGYWGSNLAFFVTNGTSLNEAMRIDRNGNVGIGTNSPGYKLDVNGAGSFEGNVIHNVGTPAAAADAATKSYVDSAFSTAGGVSGSGGTNYLPIFTGATSLGNSAIYQSGSNVGIGTTGPGVKLEVNGAETIDSGNLYINGNNNIIMWRQQGIFSTAAGLNTAGILFDNDLTKSLDLIVNQNVSALHINANGNVGIGTTSPGAPLQVSGGGGNGAPTLNLVLPTDNLWSYASQAYNANLTTGHQVIHMFGAAASTYNAGYVGFNYAGGSGSASNYVTLGLYGSDHLLNILGNGNVGIGTTSPGYKLDVNGAGNFESNVIHNVGTPAAASDAATKSYVDSAVSGGSGPWTLSGSNVYTSNTGYNIGIGTTNPGAPLEISHNDSIDPVSGSNVGSINLIHPSSGGMSMITFKSTVNWPSDGGYIAYYDNNSNYAYWGTSGENSALVVGTTNDGQNSASDVVVLRSQAAAIIDAPSLLIPSGNVGIGTTGPGYKLDVNGNGNFSGGVNLGSGGWSGIGIFSGQYFQINWKSAWGPYLYSAGQLGFAINGHTTPDVTINGTGVGIGTAPGYTLDVNGAGNFNSNVIHNIGTPATASDAATKSYVDSAVSGGSGPWTLSGSNVYTSNTGNSVGIGTTGPTARLDVYNGTLNNSAFQSMVRIGINNSVESTYGSFSESAPSEGLEFTRDWTSGGQRTLEGGIYGYGSQAWSSGLAFRTADWGGANYTRMVIAGNGYVGIGTLTPGYTLDVNGSGNFSQPVYVGTAVAGGQAVNVNYLNSAVSSAINGGISGTTNYISKFTGANTIGNSLLYDNGTNVGIGIATPQAKFQVNGPAYAADLGGANLVPYASDMAYYNSTVSEIPFIDGSTVTALNSAQDGSGGCYKWGQTGLIPVDPNQDYEYSMWVQSNGQQSIYMGFFVYDANGNEITSGSLGNPYFHGGGEQTNGSWKRIVAYLRSSGTPRNSDYTAVTTSNKSVNSSDWVMPSNTAYTMMRWGSCYGSGSAGRVYLYDPSVVAVAHDGNYGSIWSNFNGSNYNVGINNSSPAYILDVSGAGNFNGNVVHNIGTPVANSDAATKSYVDTVVGGGGATGNFTTLNVTGAWNISGAAAGGLNLNGYNITGVNTLAVTTIDPAYQIGGTNYETFSPSIAGVQDEVTGDGTLAKSGSDYEYAINFPKLTQGSDLWVWYQTVDFSKDTVEAIATPYGQFANIYYTIAGSTLTFHGNAAAQFSFRLTGKRFDWQKWPTQPANQSETPGFILSVKN